MQNKNEHRFFHAFSYVGGFGPQKFQRLLAYFGNLEKAWSASREELLAAGINPAQAKNFLEKRSSLSPEKLFEELERENISLLVQSHEDYPPQLKEISSAPAIIYVRGNPAVLKKKSVAVVGSRKYTEYGERVTQNLVRDLVRAGITIASGLALGIDAIAHRSALENGGATFAVLGTGIDDMTIYPRENFNLAKNILEKGGAIISEYPPRTPSLKQNFPARNRIMAGLSLGTLIVEAALSSGSLITAGFALEQNREVFAVPGPIFSPQSEGTNELIKKGAKLVQSAADILQEINVFSDTDSTPSQKIYEPKTDSEKRIWKIISSDPLHVDKISKLAKLNPAETGSALAMMEIEGAVKNVGGQFYIKL